MDPHGINVFNETDGDFLTFGVADDFKLQLFPAEDAFFDQNLTDETCGKSSADHITQFFHIVAVSLLAELAEAAEILPDLRCGKGSP